jgi:hypothetical protein
MCNKPFFERACIGENVLDLLKQKIAQNGVVALGYFIFSKKSFHSIQK